MKSVEIISDIAIEPVTVAEVKAHCNIAHDLDDDLISSLITATRQYGEHLTQRAWGEKTIKIHMDKFPCNGASIELPFPPTMSIDSITYNDEDGTEIELASIDYFLAYGLVWSAMPAYGLSWPETRGFADDLRVVYTTGYTTLPESLKAWLKTRVAGMYEQRENFVIGTGGLAASAMPRDFVDGLLDPYIVSEVA